MTVVSPAQTTIHVPADQATIQAAIDAASNGDTVLVSPGTYNERIDFKGKNITVTSVAGAATTIIDGQQLGSVVYFHSGETNGAVLSGFTIQHGKSDYGGGINIGSAAPIIEHNIVAYNNCGTGGGIYVSFSSAIVRYNVIHDNNRDASCYPAGIGGGGIEIGGAGQAQVLYNLIYENKGGYDGGGIGMWAAGQALVEGNIIRGNYSTGSSGGGMNIYNEGNSIIRNNVIVGNHGGGVIAVGNPAEFSNNTVAGNSADTATAEFVTYGISRTFRNNLIVSLSGRPALQGYYSGVTIDSTAFTYNDVFSVGGTAYVNVASQTGTNHNVSVDPMFANGPAGNFHLAMGSPAIDIADNNITIGATDVDGNPRKVAGAGGGALLDLGGYEYQGLTTMSIVATPLSFGSQKTNTASAAQRVTITNTGALTLHLAPIQIGEDFRQTNDCELPDGLPAGQICTVTVVFQPLTSGSKAESMVLTGANAGDPVTIQLSGTATAPLVSLSATSLTFANQMLFTASAAQDVTLTNTGDADLVVSSVASSGDFALMHDCATLAPNASCTISVAFTPTVTQGRMGAVTIQDDAAGAPHSVALSGTGVGPEISFSAATLYFSPQSVNTISNPQTVTVTNTGGYDLNITAVGITGDFSVQSNNCVSTLAPSGSCQVSVAFLPTTSGGRFGFLSFTDNAAGTPQQVALSGQGTVAQIQVTPFPFSTAIANASTSDTLYLIKNVGNESLVISSVSTTGEFSQTNGCILPRLPNQTCAIYLTFTPTAAGTRTGTLTIVHNGLNSPTVLPLSATALAAYPVPVLTSITPSAIAGGSPPVTLQAFGSDFYPGSTILLDGEPLTTTYGPTLLSATVDLGGEVYGEHTITVSSPEPGGGLSAAMRLLVYRSVNVSARDMVYDRFRRVFYATATSGSAQNANSIVSIEPESGTLTKVVDLGGEGRKLALSDDGQFLYVGVDGAHLLKRVNLYSGAVDLTIDLGTNYLGSNSGNVALDFVSLPGAPRAVAVSYGAYTSSLGLRIYDDGVMRPNEYTSIYDVYYLAVTSDPTMLYTSGSYNYALKEFQVTGSGLSVARTGPQYSGPLASDGTSLFVGQTVIDPATLTAKGTFTLGTPSLIYTSSIFAERGTQRAFMAGRTVGSAYSVVIWIGDSNNITVSGPLIVAEPAGYYLDPLSLSRWGSTGFAYRFYGGATNVGGTYDGDQIIFTRSSLANPSPGPNPLPSVTSLSPSNTPIRSANTVVTVEGSNFVPGAFVHWNGEERSTEFVDSTHLRAFIPSSDLLAQGSAQVTVVNPTEGGGTSGALTFGITTAGPAQVSTASVNFGNLFARSTSEPASVTVTNNSAGALPITSIGVSGNFIQSGNCGTSLAAYASCTVTLWFAPTTAGPLNGTLTIHHDVSTTPTTVSLAGTGIDLVLHMSRAGRPTRNGARLTSGVAAASRAQVEVLGGTIPARLTCATLTAGTSCTVTPPLTTLKPGTTDVQVVVAGKVNSGLFSQSVELRVEALGQTRTIVVPFGGSETELVAAAPASSAAVPEPTIRPAEMASAHDAQKPTAKEIVISGSASGDDVYAKWLRDEVPYLASEKERREFAELKSNQERDAFIEQFWELRNPEPGSAHNRFKEEHYRRLAYANEHFAGEKMGSMTDRGRVYIIAGAPDEIKNMTVTVDRIARPAQVWHYRALFGHADRNVRFLDVCSCGDFRYQAPEASPIPGGTR